MVDLVVAQQVVDDAAEEGDVAAGTDRRVKSETDAERVKRGSTTTSLAPLRFARSPT